ncbi:hypothetical protein [Herbaspirillum sp. CF444]|uniref:hypothetical protein n=1 Tax=Herbaspirillum sp. CF444 TaxID=1144319 RepID=UPI0012F872A0|nr:hypothetical protein [Herbaspirillum sp. CF444]
MMRQDNVLLLPTFGQAKIINPIFRGVKKGCPSLSMARRKKEANCWLKNSQPEPNPRSVESVMMDLCHDIISSVLSGECKGLIYSVHRGDHHTWGTVGSYRDDKSLSKYVSGAMFSKYREATKNVVQLQLIGGKK